MRWLRIFSVVFLCGVLAVFGPGCGDSGDTASPRTPAHLAKTSPDNDITPTFSWHAADGGPGIDHYTVSIDEGEPADVGNVTEYTAGDGISEGSHTIVVTPYDGEGNAGEGASLTFVCDATPPAVSAVAVSSITETRATITWTTSENATSQVEYGPTTGYGSSSSLDTGLLTTHSVSLSGLASGTTIHYRVKSKDGSGNESRSDDGSFSTCGAAGPAVSGIAASEIGETSAKITWTTDKPATSQVRYGPGANHNSETAPDAKLVTSHTVTLTGLQPGTTYYFLVVSRDGCGKEAQGEQKSFATLAPAEGLAESLAAALKEVCASTTRATGKIPETGKILVVWADSAELVDEVQALLAAESQPGREEEVVFVAGLTRTDVKVGSYDDGQAAYRIDYQVKLFLYQQRQLVSERTVEGSQPPYIKHVAGAGYGAPPGEAAAVWLAERTGGSLAGAVGGHQEPVTAIDFSPDGRLLASSSEDGNVCIWDVTSGEKTLTLPGHKTYGSGCRDVEFSPDGTLIAFSGDSAGVRVFRIASGAQVATIDPCTYGSGVDGLAFSPDGGMLATAGPYCGGVVLWNTATWDRIVQLDNATTPEFVAWSPDGKLLASGRPSPGDDVVVVWDVQSRTALREIVAGSTPNHAAFSPASDRLAIATWLNDVTVWDVASGSMVAEADRSGVVNAVDFSPDGTMVAFACSDGGVSICDATSGEVVSTVQVSRDVNTLDWSPDGEIIAFAGDDGLVHLMDVESGQLVNRA